MMGDINFGGRNEAKLIWSMKPNPAVFLKL